MDKKRKNEKSDVCLFTNRIKIFSDRIYLNHESLVLIVLYIIGGAARAGKSIISRKFMLDTGIPCFSLDILMMGLANGLPEYGINPIDPDFLNAGKNSGKRYLCLKLISTVRGYQ